jgi:ABC-type sugar transport system ATPase subunit
MTTPGPVLELVDVSKRFGPVEVLTSINFSLAPGEVHALIGENGAGKSTAMKILSGLLQPTTGTLLSRGQEVHFRTPHIAQSHGVSLVPQDILTVPGLSVGRNILLGNERRISRAGALSGRERAMVRTALERVGGHIDEDTPARALMVSDLRLAQLARTLTTDNLSVLVLDEPTAVLSETDSRHLLDQVRSFRAAGVAIAYISHRLTEILELADRITVLRDGAMVGTFARGEVSREQLIKLMAKDGAPNGLEPSSGRITGREVARPVLEIRNLTGSGGFEAVSFDVGRGEIVGIAGVQGSGHGELLKTLAGGGAPTGGSVSVDGSPIRLRSLRDGVKAGLAYISADRKNAAIAAGLSLTANIALSPRVPRPLRRAGIRWSRAERSAADRYVREFAVIPQRLQAKAGELSGGNQQKLALARALETAPKILMIEEPTQGVDVHGKTDIRRLLRAQAASAGLSQLIASSDFEELIGLADKIVVMREGRVTAVLGHTATYEEILHHAL